jgi:hypothetical protein
MPEPKVIASAFWGEELDRPYHQQSGTHKELAQDFLATPSRVLIPTTVNLDSRILPVDLSASGHVLDKFRVKGGRTKGRRNLDRRRDGVVRVRRGIGL